MQSAPQHGIQRKLGRNSDVLRDRNVQIVHEPQQRRLVLVQLPEGVLVRLQSRLQNLLQDLALFIPEKVLEGVRVTAKTLIDEMNRGGNVGARKCLPDRFCKIAVRIVACERSNAAVHVMVAEVNYAEDQYLGVL